MGRRKLVLSVEEVAERKRRWWGPERNARRRARYQAEPGYREKAIQQVRESYRREREGAGLPVRRDDCRESLPLLSEIGRVRGMRINGEPGREALCFTVEELARAVGRNKQVVYRWINDDMLPAPVLEAMNHRGRWQDVFGDTEVRAILLVFGEHQQASQYYRAFHLETRERMMVAVRLVRSAQPRPPTFDGVQMDGLA